MNSSLNLNATKLLESSQAQDLNRIERNNVSTTSHLNNQIMTNYSNSTTSDLSIFDEGDFVIRAFLFIILPFTIFIFIATFLICKLYHEKPAIQHVYDEFYEPSFTFTEVSDSEENTNILIDDDDELF